MLNKLSILLSFILICVWGYLLTQKSGLNYARGKIATQLTFADQIEFDIKINKVGLKRLDEFAKRSLKIGFLSKESKQWVPCKVLRKNLIVPCKIRLRGDLPKHWEGIKRSYRIKFKEPSPFWGWKKVDLILPEDKGLESELVGYELSKELGMIAPGAHFSSIGINGIRTGTYFVKQGDSGSLFELNKRTESMLIRENNFWWFAHHNGSIYKQLMMRNTQDSSNLRSLPIIYSPTFSGDAASNLTFSRFADFLNRVSDSKDLSNHLNITIYYKWLVLVMSFGSIHSTLPDNLFWYISASTGLVEPVVYDLIPSKLYKSPLRLFKMKSFLIRNILAQTWDKGGKEHFLQALTDIEQKVTPIYEKVITERKLYNSFVRIDDYFSEDEARERLENLRHNIKLIRLDIQK